MTTPDDLKKLVTFFHFLESLKKLERYKDQIFWRDYDWIKRWESVADHTWRMGMMLVVLEKRLQKPVDLEKALKMILIHDLPEIIAGDPSPLGSDGTGRDSHRHSKEKRDEKDALEDKAAREIFAMLPGDEGDEWYALWRESEDQQTYEAQVIKAIDKIEAKFFIMENTKCRMYEGQIEPFKNYGVDSMIKEPIIKEMFDELVTYFDEHYQEFKK